MIRPTFRSYPRRLSREPAECSGIVRCRSGFIPDTGRNVGHSAFAEAMADKKARPANTGHLDPTGRADQGMAGRRAGMRPPRASQLGFSISMKGCHSERSEESIETSVSPPSSGNCHGSFATLRMTNWIAGTPKLADLGARRQRTLAGRSGGAGDRSDGALAEPPGQKCWHMEIMFETRARALAEQLPAAAHRALRSHLDNHRKSVARLQDL